MDLSKLHDNHKETLSCENISYRAKPVIMGIDPGLTGAIAIIESGKLPKFIAVHDIPTIKVKNKNRTDLKTLSLLIDIYADQTSLALIEEVGQVGTNADPFSSFVFGFTTGAVHGVLAAYGVETLAVRPNIWKATLGLNSNKADALAKAISIFPAAKSKLRRKKDHGRAEALLLAHFANSFRRNK